MKIPQPVIIGCNKHGCAARFTGSDEAMTLHRARVEARRVGWSSSGSTLDHCPEHAGPNTASPKAIQKERKERKKEGINQHRNKIVKDLVAGGGSIADVAKAVGLTRQRVAQILENG